MVQQGQLFQPLASQQRHMRREGQRAQAGIGTDIGRRLVTADMLFAGRQRQHEPAISVGVNGLPAQTPWHLADQFLRAGKQANIGPAEIEAVADGLALAHGNVRPHLSGRRDKAQRNGFGKDRYKQRALVMSGLCGFR